MSALRPRVHAVRRPDLCGSRRKAVHPAPQREKLTIAPEEVKKPWSGDLDGMIQRGIHSRPDGVQQDLLHCRQGDPSGARPTDAGTFFVEDLNKKLAKDNKLKQKHIKMRVLFIPLGRGELLPALAAGKGDIAIGRPRRD
jgi:hypothetical protein